MKSRSFLLSLLLLGLGIAPGVTQARDHWAGRKLSAVLDELRAGGLPLLYSSQVVSDELVIDQEPDAVLQLERLRQALEDLGLELQSLEPVSQGYAIVRSQRPRKQTASVSAPPSPVTPALDEITVFASRYNLTREQSGTTSTYLPHASLEKTAGIEQDVLRSVQFLPGTSGNSLSTLTHVRGGHEDENLVRFDGVELYNPVHLKSFQGLFGLLDPDWVQSLNFYSGAYPVQYGNHNAAVIDIAPRRTMQPEFTVGTSLLYTRLLSTGSYDDAAGHWLLGYRRSNVAAVMRHTEKNIGEPEFEDLLLRHSYTLGNGELRVGALLLNDDLELQTDTQDQRANAHDRDTYLWAGWQQDWTDTLRYSLQFAHTQLSSRRNAEVTLANINDGNLHDHRAARLFTLDSQINLQSSEHTQWQWGLHLNHSRARYEYASTARYFAPLNVTFDKPATLQQSYAATFQKPDYASYLNLTHEQGAWHGELGLRYDVFPYLDHGTQLSPRINLQYTISPAAAMHFSAGNYVQAPGLHALDSSASTPQFHAPERMRQYILGWTQTLSPSAQLRIEGYHKYGSRLAPRNENLLSFITLGSELEIDRILVNATHSRAQGIEISLTAPAQQDFGWWLNYSWSRVQDELNGRYVRRTWDQPHAFTAGANWTHARWLLSGSATWHSGWAYTPLILSSDGSSATLGARNSQRFGDFASLELRTQYTIPMRGAQLQTFLEVRNALNRSNECCRELTVNTASGTPVISVQKEGALSLIPIVGFNLKF